MNNPLDIDTKQEEKRITKFISDVFEKQNMNTAVIGLSGGIDSMTSAFLAINALGVNNVIVIHMPYFTVSNQEIETLKKETQISEKNFHVISIQPMVDTLKKTLTIADDDHLRLGNIMARARMIILFDFAKKHKALVVGTENKSEHLLAYYTRYGDEASDVEPIMHLYKTQVKQLSASLGISEEIINQPPTAGLWEGQTDEKQFGFTYEEADLVLYYYLEKNESLEEIEKKGFVNAQKIIDWVERNDFKHHVPFSLKNV